MATASSADPPGLRWSVRQADRWLATTRSIEFRPGVLDRVGVHGTDRLVEQRVGRVRGDQHDARMAGGARDGREVVRFLRRQRPGRPGHDVQSDRIGAGADRRLDAERVGHAADLHERSTGDVGRVIGLPTGGDERGRLGARIVAPHQRLADQGGVEPERPPAPRSSTRRGRPTRR